MTTNTTAAGVQGRVDAGDRVILGDGRHILESLVYLDRPGAEIRGAGPSRTVVAADGVNSCAFVIGIPRVGLNGEMITAVHRPDAYGVLDAGAAPKAGARAGVASRREIIGACVSHPLQFGGPSRAAPGTWDEWSETTALTVEVALSSPAAALPPSAHVCGAGSLDGDVDAPWALRTDANGDFLVAFSASDGLRHMFGFPAGTPTPTGSGPKVYRVAFWIDLKVGRYGARCQGKAARVNPIYGFPPDGAAAAAGAGAPVTFAHQRGDYPFTLFVRGREAQAYGASVPVPDLTVWGLNVRSAAVDADPGSDLLRYFTYTPDTVAYLPLDDVAPKRHINVTAGGYDLAPLFLLHSTPGWFAPTYDATLADFATDAADVILGGTMRLRCDDVRFSGRYTGLASLPFTISYPSDFRRCVFRGGQAALSLYGHSKATFSACDLEYGGRVHAALRGCNVLWLGGMAQFSSPATRCAVDVLRDDGGGRYVFQSFYLDSEARAMTEAVFAAAQSPNTPMFLGLKDCYACKIAPGAFVKLTGTGNPADRVSRFSVADCSFDDSAEGTVALHADGHGWSGTFETQGRDVDSPDVPGYRLNPDGDPARRGVG